MQIQLITIGQRMPQWVEKGFEEYAKRFSTDWKLHLVEIPANKRTKTANLEKIKEEESQRLFAAAPKSSYIIALDERGKLYDTATLAKQLTRWQTDYQQLSLLIGGPDGLSDAAREKAHHLWSLSPLTLPHPLVRIIVAEQLYRALSLLRGHPYHRA